MRGLRLKFSIFEHKVLTGVLTEHIRATDSPPQAEACRNILNQIQTKLNKKYNKARGR